MTTQIKDFETAELFQMDIEGVENQLEKTNPGIKDGIIYNMVQNLSGIESPSTIYKGSGENIMEGLLKGMKDGILISNMSLRAL